MNSPTLTSPTKIGKPAKVSSPANLAKDFNNSPYTSHLRRERSEDLTHNRPLESLQIIGISPQRSPTKQLHGSNKKGTGAKSPSKPREALASLSEQNSGNQGTLSSRDKYVEDFKFEEDQENEKKELMDRKLAKMKERLQKRDMEREKQKQLAKGTPKVDPNHNEQDKIQTYFRFRVGSLTRLVEERVRNNSLLGKVGRSKTISTSKLQAQLQPMPPALEEAYTENQTLKEEIWKNLRRFASTKSKYKYRDLINYEKKVLIAMKTLLPRSKNTSNKQNPILLELEDEQSKQSQTVDGQKPKPRPPDAQKLAVYKQKRKENLSAKIFIINGPYPDLVTALEKRGWIENPDATSKEFDLIWSLKKTEIDYAALNPNQSVNHFEKNTSITTKVGLARNIRNLIWYANEDPDHIYPRCYDLNDVQEFDDFLEEFKLGKAIATLRLITSLKKISGNNEDEIKLWKLRLCVSLGISERRLKPIELAVDDILRGRSMTVTQEEWEIMTFPDQNSILKGDKYRPLKKALEAGFGVHFENTEKNEEDELLEKASAMLLILETSFPQIKMNQGRNIWIIKPAGLSRGRGIRCYDNLAEILEHVKVKESEWVAQKYIENPLIIKNRKFDIRQWVLVSDWNPLTIWFFDECYVRFTAQEFNPDDLSNKFAHLTNNSVSKKFEMCDTSEIEGNMWTLREFRDYLVESTGKDQFEAKIHQAMKDIVIKSLQSVQDMVESRKNAFELYGYDFMIDEDFNPWLIEINSSPTMEYSTSVTERLVKMVMEDSIKVAVDYGRSKPKDKRNVDTGSFRCIYPQCLHCREIVCVNNNPKIDLWSCKYGCI